MCESVRHHGVYLGGMQMAGELWVQHAAHAAEATPHAAEADICDLLHKAEVNEWPR